MQALGLLLVAIVAALIQVALGKGRGYALGFQGRAPLAANKNGFIDFTNEGWRDVDDTFSITVWIKYFDTRATNPFSFNNEAEANWFQLQGVRVWAFSQSLIGNTDIDTTDWVHFAIIANGTHLGQYMNGNLVFNKEMKTTFRTEPLGMQLGAHTYTLHDTPIKAEPSVAFHGAMDEFGFWSRALSQTEVQEIMNQGLSTNQIETDPSLVLYYDMEVRCDSINVQRNNNGLQGDTCDISGRDLIRNRGRAGKNYDLLLGSMNNAFGYGNTWIPTKVSGTDTCSAQTGYAFDFPRPTYSLDDKPLSNDNLDTPGVHFCNPGQWVEIDVLSGFRLEDPPASGRLSTQTSGGSTITQGTIVSPGQVFYQCPNGMGDNPIWLTFASTTAGNALHQVHFWKFRTTQPQDTKRVINEDEVDAFDSAVGQYMLPAGKGPVEIVTTRVVQRPSKGRITSPRFPTGIPQGGMIEELSGTISFSPIVGESGNDYAEYKIEYVGKWSGLISSVATISIDVLPINDLPLASPLLLAIEEDSDMQEISLSVTDTEEGLLDILITSLPTKGKLYYKDIETDKFVQIDTPYSEYDVRDPISQYVDDVISVSNFWGEPPDLGYHPIGIIGRPQCGSKDSDCFVDERVEGTNFVLQVGDIINLDRYWFEGDKPEVVVPGKVVAVNDKGETYDIQLLPLQKMDPALEEEWLSNATFSPPKEKCYMQTLSFPTGCDTAEYTQVVDNINVFNDGKGTLILRTVPREFIVAFNSGVLSFYSRAYSPSSVRSSFTSGAFGDQYEFRNYRQSEFYENSDPPFTDFVEVSFKEAVYPLDVEVAETRGAGAIVNIKALDPQGVWQSLYSGFALKVDNARTSGRGLINYFNKDVCRPSFKTNALRLEFDTSDETGIGDFQMVDYVMLTGSRELQPGMLRYGETKIYYKPDKDSDGTDTFTYRSTDCGGDIHRASDAATVTININPKPDPPNGDFVLGAVFPVKDGTYLVLPSDTVTLQLKARDVDGSDTATILDVKTDGLQLTGIQTSPARDEQNATVKFDPCTNSDEKTASIAMKVQDSNGETSTSTLVFKIQCGATPRRFELNQLDTTARTVAIILGAVGVLFSLVFMIFNLSFRKRQVVLMSSPRVNILILFGTMFVFAYIMSLSATFEGATGCDVSDLVNQTLADGFDLTCEATGSECCQKAGLSHCSAPVWLLSLGLLLVFAPLVGKTSRISKIFNAKAMQRVRITDRDIFVRVGVQAFLLIVGLAIWTVMVPTSLSFEVQRESFNAATQERVVYLSGYCVAGNSFGTVVAVLIVLSIALVLQGAYEAYQIRNVFVKQANDSREIFISIYNITIFGGMCLVLAFTISDEVPKFYITVILTWLATVLTMFALFIPRMLEVARGEEVNLSSSGTRRNSSSHRDSSSKYTNMPMASMHFNMSTTKGTTKGTKAEPNTEDDDDYV